MITVTAAVGLIISAIAPGNLIRASQTTQMSPLNAILKSIIIALKHSIKWTKLPQIGMLIFLIPVIYFICKEAKFSFRYPAVAFRLSRMKIYAMLMRLNSGHIRLIGCTYMKIRIIG